MPSNSTRFRYHHAAGVVFDLETSTFYTLDDVRFLLAKPKARGKLRALQMAMLESLLPQLEGVEIYGDTIKFLRR